MNLFPVAILAGGLGTRLGDLTKNKPKCLVDVNGKPFIIRQLELLLSQGIEKVVLCLGHRAEEVYRVVCEARVGGTGLGNLEIKASYDGDELIGTAGAIRKALPLLGGEFFVLYGDSYLECDYRAIQEAYIDSGKMALMTVNKVQCSVDGNAVVVGRRVVCCGENCMVGQPTHVDYGIGVFRREAFGCKGRDLLEVYTKLARAQRLGAFEMPDRFREIGSPWGLEVLRSYLENKEAHVFHKTQTGIEGTVILATHTPTYLDEVKQIVDKLDQRKIERMVGMLNNLRARKGRLFILGVGGSAANASHAVNDFRKICGIEAYAPTDNVAELTARTNDDGWEDVFLEWLITSHASKKDMILVLSVGGGTMEASYCIARALCVIADRPEVVGIVGKTGGYTAELADECLVIPEIDPGRVTPHAEEFQSVILHLMVSHPRLKQ